jgi:hypothetical protein
MEKTARDVFLLAVSFIYYYIIALKLKMVEMLTSELLKVISSIVEISPFKDIVWNIRKLRKLIYIKSKQALINSLVT